MAQKDKKAQREVLLDVKNLKQYFQMNRKYTVKAVDGISFQIHRGETYGLVGESGSGKSTTGRSIIRLYDCTAGEVVFDGKIISGELGKETAAFLRTNMQMIFQNPMSCLSPRKKVMDIIAQGLDVHHSFSNKQEREEKVYSILEKVGLSREQATRFPHQFSGGQRQRIGIARALIMLPKLVIADPQARWDSLAKAEKILLEQDAAIFPTVQNGLGMLINPKVHGLDVRNTSITWNYRFVTMDD